MKNNKRKSRTSVLTALGAALVVFFVSAIWYTAFGGIMATLNAAYAQNQNSSLWIMPVELGCGFIVAFSFYYLARKCGISHWKDSLKLGILLWVFPVFILLGSIIHEHYPVELALIHTGDWLIKLLVISAIMGWRLQKNSK